MESDVPRGEYFLGSGGVQRVAGRGKRSKEETARTLAPEEALFQYTIVSSLTIV